MADEKIVPATTNVSAKTCWTEEDYRKLQQQLATNVSAQELMKKFGIKRRDALKARIMDMSLKLGVVIEPSWLQKFADIAPGKRVLPPLRVGSDGSLRISKERFERSGLHVQKGVIFEMEAAEDGFTLIRK